jgi:pimeloyl-ACP methyl ester carboxylesterase
MGEAEWEAMMIPLEQNIVRHSGLEDCQTEFTMIEMDGAPFKVRTTYVGRAQSSKPTLVYLHGNMAFALGECPMLLKALSSDYRIVAFDLMNLGMNTRSGETHRQKVGLDPEAAEAWIQEWAEKTFRALDLPERFFLVGKSWGTYLASLYASMHPERIEGLFLLSPNCTRKYDLATYTPYGCVGPDCETWEPVKDSERHVKRTAEGKHGYSMELHDQSPCMKKFVLWALTKFVFKPLFLKGPTYTPALADAICKYLAQMLARTGAGDVTMEPPFKWFSALIHRLDAPDRLNQPACSFPIAVAFGSRDIFASNTGAEELLETLKQHNGGRVNLFKIGGDDKKMGGDHTFYIVHEEATRAAIVGHFNGSITGRWETTVEGAHISKPRPAGPGSVAPKP